MAAEAANGVLPPTGSEKGLTARRTAHSGQCGHVWTDHGAAIPASSTEMPRSVHESDPTPPRCVTAVEQSESADSVPAGGIHLRYRINWWLIFTVAGLLIAIDLGT